MAIPLSLVRAKLVLFDPGAGRRDIVCMAVSCSAVIVNGRLVEADVLSHSHLTQHNSEQDDEETQDLTELRKLARLLLCPDHKDELCEETARAWEERRPDNDLFRLFKLNRNPFDWKCLAEHCDTAYNISRRRALAIMEMLTFNEVAGRCLSSEKRETFVRELVGLLHCDKHCTPENITQASDKWNDILTEAIQRRKPKETSYKMATPMKGELNDALDENPTKPEHRAEVRVSEGTSSKNSVGPQPCSESFGSPSRGLFAGLEPSSGDSFGRQSGFGNFGSSSGGLFGSQSGSGGLGSSRGGLFGSQTGSGGFGSSSTGATAPKFNFSGFGSSSTGSTAPRCNFGGFGSPSSSLTSKLVLDGNPAPPSASQSGSLNSGSLTPNASPSSSRKTPVSTAEQTETASQGAKGSVASTADDKEPRSSNSRRTASPRSRTSSANRADHGGSPVTNGLGPSSSATKAIDTLKSHSSCDIGVFGHPPHENRPPQLRDTQSYPCLPSEGRTPGPDPKRAILPHTSPSSASLQAEEDAVFEKANKNVEPQQIDMKLLSYIRSNKADTGKKLVASLGDVYVLRNPEWPNHVKIGQTRGDPDKRMAAIRRRCKMECLEQVVDTERKDFRNYELVEKLCHKELKNFKKKALMHIVQDPKGRATNAPGMVPSQTRDSGPSSAEVEEMDVPISIR